ncbi:hypothetical protein BH20ACI1_BH20ACI1_07480 [soil metagenome]
MSNLRLRLLLVVISGLLCGFVGMIIGAIAGTGTSILLPGLGLIISGSLFLGVLYGLVGIFLGSILGLFAAAIIIRRRKNFP